MTGRRASLLLCAFALGCHGRSLAKPHAEGGAGADGDTTVVDGGAAGGGGMSAGLAGTSGTAGASGGAGSTAPATGGPEWVPIRRLTNVEYDLTVHELLGVDGQARTAFMADPRQADPTDDFFLSPHDVTDARYEEWFDAAEALATATFADPALRARIVTCHPAAPTDDACTRAIAGAFGLRAWRRPLATGELDALVALARAALASGATFEDAIARLVTASLSSAPFLYHMEVDLDVTSAAVHALTPYELASRLSYLVWRSMPDDKLFAHAGDGSLLRDDVLRTEVDRLLDDPRAEAFLDGFGGGWLGGVQIAEHEVAISSFAARRDAMAAELRLYVKEILGGNGSLARLLDTDVNFVDISLASLYGMPTTGRYQTLVRVVDTTDHRKGLLGLAAVLTLTSSQLRTSATARGAWILSRLLCAPPLPPPAGTPDDIAPTRPEAQRALVDSLASNPACASCHRGMDGLGMALGGFDFEGVYQPPSPDVPIDEAGRLLDGTPVVGEPALADALAADPRFLKCAARQAMRYALGRDLGTDDEPELANVVGAWTRGVPTMRALLEELVLDDAFRFRRAEASP